MKNKKGISLIVLIVTIIVIIILAAVVILTLSKNNPIESAKEARFKEDIRAYQDELNIYIAKEYQQLGGQRDTKITAMGYEKDSTSTDYYNSVYKYLSSFEKKYEGKIAIKDDQIAYIGIDEKERNLLSNSGVYMSKKITIKYVNEDKEELKESNYITTIDGKYVIDSPDIEGYTAAISKVVGEVSEDCDVCIEYCIECDDLAFIGLDSDGNETTEESNIVAYTVSGKGSCKKKNIVIPRTHNNKPVTRIKTNAFKNNNTIENLVVQDNVEVIEQNAFYTTGSGAKIKNLKINSINFESCAYLDAKVLELDENVSNVGNFSNCRINTLIINSDKLNISGSNFSQAYSTALKNIIVNSDNTKYKVIDNVLYSKDEKILYLYPNGREGGYKIPSEVEEIVGLAFACNAYLNEIEIPSTVKLVGSSAFYCCTNLTNVKLNAEKFSGGYCFPNTLTDVEIGTNVSYIGSRVFDSVSEIRYKGSIEEWNKITKIGWYIGTKPKIICTDGEIVL